MFFKIWIYPAICANFSPNWYKWLDKENPMTGNLTPDPLTEMEVAPRGTKPADKPLDFGDLAEALIDPSLAQNPKDQKQEFLRRTESIFGGLLKRDRDDDVFLDKTPHQDGCECTDCMRQLEIAHRREMAEDDALIAEIKYLIAMADAMLRDFDAHIADERAMQTEVPLVVVDMQTSFLPYLLPSVPVRLGGPVALIVRDRIPRNPLDNPAEMIKRIREMPHGLLGDPLDTEADLRAMEKSLKGTHLEVHPLRSRDKGFKRGGAHADKHAYDRRKHDLERARRPVVLRGMRGQRGH